MFMILLFPYMILVGEFAMVVTTNTSMQTQIMLSLISITMALAAFGLSKTCKFIEFDLAKDTVTIKEKQGQIVYNQKEIISYISYFLFFGKFARFFRIKLSGKNLYYLPTSIDSSDSSEELIKNLDSLNTKLKTILPQKKEAVDNFILFISHSPLLIFILITILFIVGLIAIFTGNIDWIKSIFQ